MRKYYRDLREFLQKLEEGGLLRTVQRPINKDLELMPVVRWQFRGNLPESARKAFLFKNVTDGRGNKYSMPVLVGGYAASRNIYALGMMCSPEEIAAKWNDAQMHPVKPILLETGPVHEEVHLGAGLLNHGGIGEFPVPVSTPGLDNAPYLSNANWVTKDPETGERNLGNYRAMIKSATRTGVFSGSHLFTHWKKCRAKGIPLQAAVVIGASPNIIYVGAGKPAYGTDEYAVAGGIAGEPVELVRCKTVDLEVPATAEIVFEGEIPTDSLEREAPFGEYTGYMGMNTMSPYFNVTCITHRRDAIYSAFISQFPPSESSVMRGIGREAAWFKLLRHDCNIAGVLRVAFHQTSGSGPYAVIQMKKYGPGDAWQALHAAYSFNPPTVKFIIAVDEDIDPGDPDSVNWGSVDIRSFDFVQPPGPTNVLGIVHLLDAARSASLRPAVLVVGSAEEYGPVGEAELPIREDAPLRPASPYAVSKVAQGALARLYGPAGGMRVVLTRTFHHTGPGRGEAFAESSFARQIAEIEHGLRPAVIEVGNLDAVRDFCDVRDVVRAYLLLLEKGEPGQAYNVCSGRGLRIREVLDLLLASSSARVEVRVDKERLRPADVPAQVGDPSRLRAATAWEPRIPIAETLRDLLSDWRARVAGVATRKA